MVHIFDLSISQDQDNDEWSQSDGFTKNFLLFQIKVLKKYSDAFIGEEFNKQEFLNIQIATLNSFDPSTKLKNILTRLTFPQPNQSKLENLFFFGTSSGQA